MKIIKNNTNATCKNIDDEIYLKIVPSNACNLSCKYCYAESGAVAYKSFLSLDELKKIADDIKKITSHANYTLSPNPDIKIEPIKVT